MDRKIIIAKVIQKLTYDKSVLKELESIVPTVLRLDPKDLSSFLLNMKKENNLTSEQLSDFIQIILLEKNNLHKKPGFKNAISNFAKENHILGLQFPYF